MITAPYAELPSLLCRSERREAAEEASVDFSLHGVVTFRLLSPLPRDIARFRERFGSVIRPSGSEPHFRVRLVDELKLPASACHLGVDAAFSTDAFYLRHSRTMDRAIASVPLDQVGRSAEICIERGGEASVLTDLINLAVLAQGGVALPGAAVEVDGRGCLIVGWSNASKTSALLGLAERGARFVSGEWTYLHPDAERLIGSRDVLEVPESHLRSVPQLRCRVDARTQTHLTALGAATAGARSAVRLARSARARTWVNRVAGAFDAHRTLRISPSQLFGERNCVGETRLDAVILCMAHGERHLEVREQSVSDVVPRLLMALEYERRRLQGHYVQFRCAFPGRWNPLLEQASALEEQRLRRALHQKPIFLVLHPHGAQPNAMASTILPLLGRGARN